MSIYEKRKRAVSGPVNRFFGCAICSGRSVVFKRILGKDFGGGREGSPKAQSSKGSGLWCIFHWRPSQNRSELVNSRCWVLWRDSSLFLFPEALLYSSVIRLQTWIAFVLSINTHSLPVSPSSFSVLQKTQVWWKTHRIPTVSIWTSDWFDLLPMPFCLFTKSPWWIKNERSSTAFASNAWFHFESTHLNRTKIRMR